MRLPLHAALIALGLLAAAAPDRVEAAAFTIAPPAAWVEPLRADLETPPGSAAEGGVEYLVVDDQIRVGPGERQAYRRLVTRVVSTKGIEDGSDVRVDFDPQYERLVLHGITIHRGAARIPALHPGEVKIIQRERELDRRLYDGRLTAVIFLRDVRVGDVVESSYTLVGSNPIFEGRFADGFDLGHGVPVERLGVRILLPEGRPLAWRTHGVDLPPAVGKSGDLIEYRWSRQQVASFEDEGDLPAGLRPYPWMEVSEWGEWADVVRWALPLYAPDEPSAAMAERIAAWRKLPDEAARATAALRFVQDEVRYLGIELGPSSHRPHRPAEVFERRFGDCKDKALLLVTIFRALGIEAAPALVDTNDRGTVESRVPSPFAFDHVIVRARIDGAERWLEPTRSLEHAPVQLLQPPPYERALILSSGVVGPEPIPAPTPPRLEVESRWTVARFAGPIQFEVVTRYEGARAVAMRHQLAESSPAELQRRYLNYYGHGDPEIRAAAPLEIVDYPTSDRVTITERYELPPAAESEERDFRAGSIREQLGDPETTLRKFPLRVFHPVVVTERLRIELPGAPALSGEQEVISSDAAKLTYTARIEPRAVVLDYEYRSLAPSIAPAAVARHLDALRKMRETTAISFPLSVDRAKASESPSVEAAKWVGLLGLMLLALLLASRPNVRAAWTEWRGARRRRAFASKFEHALGESAQSPILVCSHAEIPARLSGLRCRCGALLDGLGEGERLLCGGREVIVHALLCNRCGARRRAYFGVGG